MNMITEEEIIAASLLYLQQHYHLTKKQLAASLGISMYFFSKLEKGIIPPRMPADALERVYDVCDF